jgi:twitching motility protein PilI
MRTTHVTINNWVSKMPTKLEAGPNPPLPSANEDCIFGIRVGSIGLLVSPETYCEVLDDIPINPPPYAVPWLNGFLNLRGNLVPLFDLHVIFCEEVSNQNNRRLFVIGRGEHAAAIWIDDLPVLKSRKLLLAVTGVSTLSRIQQCFVSAAYENTGQIWFNINYEGLFLALDFQCNVEEGSLSWSQQLRSRS